LAGLQSRLAGRVTINYAQGYSGVYQPYRRRGDTSKKVDKPDSTMTAQAVAAAKKSDMAILLIGGNRDYESEGRDRTDLSLPFHEQELVDAVTAVNPNTIVVVIGGAPYDIGKIKQNNSTIVWSWYNGSEAGNALADVLLGKVNPSGRLPFTFPVELKDSPAHALDAYPGQNLQVDYKEGILVGYRWFDTKKIAPMYCFGYGLSYTDYQYSGFKTDKDAYKTGETITTTIKVKNTGKYGGKETVQLYVSKTGSTVERPEKELKSFKKVTIAPGQTANVSLTIPVKDLAYYDVKTSKWVVEPGKYKILAGASSRDIKGSASITVN
jgi:beta-glucosidase